MRILALTLDQESAKPWVWPYLQHGVHITIALLPWAFELPPRSLPGFRAEVHHLQPYSPWAKSYPLVLLQSCAQVSQQLASYLVSEVSLYFCDAICNCFVKLYIPSLDLPNFLNDFFFKVHTLRFTLDAVKVNGFWQMHSVMYPPLLCHTEWFHHPGKTLCITVHLLPFPLNPWQP